MTENSTQEIERKYLVLDNSWKKDISESFNIKQVYVSKQSDGWLTRLRIIDDNKAEITIKGPKEGISGSEYNLPMDIDSARDLWSKSNGERIEKTRSIINNSDGTKWEIDEFIGEQIDQVVLAEIELSSEEQAISLPAWVGLEVSGLRLYSNDYLAQTTRKTEDGMLPIPLSQNMKGILKVLGVDDAHPQTVDAAMFNNIMAREQTFGSNFTKEQILPDEQFLNILKISNLKGTFTLRKLRIIEELMDDSSFPNDYHRIFDDYSRSTSSVNNKLSRKIKP